MIPVKGTGQLGTGASKILARLRGSNGSQVLEGSDSKSSLILNK